MLLGVGRDGCPLVDKTMRSDRDVVVVFVSPFYHFDKDSSEVVDTQNRFLDSLLRRELRKIGEALARVPRKIFCYSTDPTHYGCEEDGHRAPWIRELSVVYAEELAKSDIPCIDVTNFIAKFQIKAPYRDSEGQPGDKWCLPLFGDQSGRACFELLDHISKVLTFFVRAWTTRWWRTRKTDCPSWPTPA